MFETLFSQYNEYETIDIVLEIIGVLFGLASVLFAKKNNILVYPTGIISTIIFVYLLNKWGLMGDMMINIYYTTMSIYGWYLWSRKSDDKPELPITSVTSKELYYGVLLFILTVVFVLFVYNYFDKFTDWTAYVDTFTTGIFFVGMWLMAKRKLENWVLLNISNIISIPLMIHKDLYLYAILSIILFCVAISGYLNWRKILNNRQNA